MDKSMPKVKIENSENAGKSTESTDGVYWEASDVLYRERRKTLSRSLCNVHSNITNIDSLGHC